MSTNQDNQNLLPKADMHNERGIQLAEKGWLIEAIKEFKKAIAIDPHASQSFDNLGNAYSESGDFLNALSAYTNALKLEPDNPFALHNLGIFLSNHASKLASVCFKKALHIEPELFESRFHLGLCLAAEEKHDEAIGQFLWALKDAPDDMDIRLELALSYMELDKDKEAIGQFLLITKNESNNADAWFHLGSCFYKRKFFSEAENAINKSLTINPNNIEGILLLASLYTQKGHNKEARLLVKKANRMDSKLTKSYIESDEYLSL
jgi:tetratricopeptide (TPR) repeat protein